MVLFCRNAHSSKTNTDLPMENLNQSLDELPTNALCLQPPEQETDPSTDPPDSNSDVFEYLWEGPAKIKQSIAVKQYCQGGLQIINLKAFINSLKLTWLRRVILSNSPWRSVLKKYNKFQRNIYSRKGKYIISYKKCKK